MGLPPHLPESLFIGTGFIVTTTESSKQIDLLIIDKERPRLFWDGDVVIVTPDAVRAVIEVETGLDGPAAIEEAIMKLAESKKAWHKSLYGWNNWLGLFVFEAWGDHEDAILLSLEKAREEHNIKFDCVAYGPNLFVDRPKKIGQTVIEGYVSRNLEGLAAACFVTKLISYFSEVSMYSNPLAWQPHVGNTISIKYVTEGGEIQTLGMKV